MLDSTSASRVVGACASRCRYRSIASITTMITSRTIQAAAVTSRSTKLSERSEPVDARIMRDEAFRLSLRTAEGLAPDPDHRVGGGPGNNAVLTTDSVGLLPLDADQY